jgi:hypothetical protein
MCSGRLYKKDDTSTPPPNTTIWEAASKSTRTKIPENIQAIKESYLEAGVIKPQNL